MKSTSTIASTVLFRYGYAGVYLKPGGDHAVSVASSSKQPRAQPAGFGLVALVVLARALALVASIAASIAVFWGLRGVLAADGGLASWITPAAAAVALATLLGGGWHILMGMVPRAQGARVPIILGLGIGLTAVAIATSSWWLAAGLGGSTAVRHHHSRIFMETGAAASAILQQAEPEREVVQAVRLAQSTYQGLAEGEIKEGRISGKAGPGRVSRELTDAAQALGQQQTAMLDLIGRRESVVAAARAALQQAQRGSAAGNEAEVGAFVGDALAHLAEAQRLSVVDLAGSAGMVQIGSSGLARLEEATARIAEVARRVRQDRKPIELPVWQPMGRAEAVIVYSDHVALAWVVAVAIDLMPLLLLGMLLTARRQDEDDMHGANDTRVPPANDGGMHGSSGEVVGLRRPAQPTAHLTPAE
jgi:hypothetical protein